MQRRIIYFAKYLLERTAKSGNSGHLELVDFALLVNFSRFFEREGFLVLM